MTHIKSYTGLYTQYTLKNRIIRIIVSFTILFVGGLIYVVYRDKSLLMFDWFDSIGIGKQVDYMRGLVQCEGIYGWVKYSLPDGLWLFSYMFIVDAIWNGDKNSLSFMFIWGLPFVALLSEFFQYFGLCPGVFDWIDLVSYMTAIILFVIIKLLK
ncbi:MAG: hypothetical protein IKO71_05360 [Bacteroidaceae bacterium]|nr:hypothetical protein [Bacteroidaceae bacterium]